MPKHNLSKIPINALGISLNNPPSRKFLPSDNPSTKRAPVNSLEGGGAGELEGSNPFIHSRDAWHCSEPRQPPRLPPQQLFPSTLPFMVHEVPAARARSGEASQGGMQENT